MPGLFDPATQGLFAQSFNNGGSPNMSPQVLQALFSRMLGNRGQLFGPGSGGNAGSFGGFGSFAGNAPPTQRQLPSFGTAMRPMPIRQIPAMPPPQDQPMLPQQRMPTPYNPPVGRLPPTQTTLSPTLNNQTGGYSVERLAQVIREAGLTGNLPVIMSEAAKYGVNPAQAQAAAEMAAGGARIVAPNYDAPPQYVAPPPPPATPAPGTPGNERPPVGTPEYYQWLYQEDPGQWSGVGG